MPDRVDEAPPGTWSALVHPQAPNRFLAALRLQTTGIVTFFLLAAVTYSVIVSDVGSLMIGSAVLSIGVIWIVWSWYRLEKLAKTYPSVVSMFPPVVQRLPRVLSKTQIKIYISIIMALGFLLSFIGIWLLLSSQPLGVSITLLGAILLYAAVLGIRPLWRRE
jgi:hypothetical protein